MWSIKKLKVFQGISAHEDVSEFLEDLQVTQIKINHLKQDTVDSALSAQMFMVIWIRFGFIIIRL